MGHGYVAHTQITFHRFYGGGFSEFNAVFYANGLFQAFAHNEIRQNVIAHFNRSSLAINGSDKSTNLICEQYVLPTF